MKEVIVLVTPLRTLSIEGVSEVNRKLYQDIINAVTKPLLEEALMEARGNQLKAAKILGINRNTLRTKIRKLGIDINKSKYGLP